VTWDGFEETDVAIDDATYRVARGGAGPPVLLLHGFPQTHECWHRIAPALAATHRVIAPDLRGYGESSAPAGGPHGEGYTKREVADELVRVMAHLGHDRFAVVGHDRGARVTSRMALDHPDRVARAAVLNVVPTVDQFERMGAGPSLGYWPWFLLAAPAPLPERLLGADPAAVLDHAFDTWADRPEAIDAERRGAYRRAMTPETVAAMCADYRASFHLDREHEAADRRAGRRISVPLLVLTGEAETQLADAAAVWRTWADDVEAGTVPGGHFLPEEAAREVLARLQSFLGG
jgi:haloacetate dehalogenase